MEIPYSEKLGFVRIPEMESHYLTAIDFLHAHRLCVALFLIVSVVGSAKFFTSVSKKLKVSPRRKPSQIMYYVRVLKLESLDIRREFPPYC